MVTGARRAKQKRARFVLLLVVIVNVNNLRFIGAAKNENCAVFLINLEAPDFHFARLEQFGV